MKTAIKILVMAVFCITIISCKENKNPDIPLMTYENLEAYPYNLNYKGGHDFEVKLPEKPEIFTIFDREGKNIILQNIEVYDDSQLVANLYYDSSEVEFSFLTEDKKTYRFKTEYGEFIGYDFKKLECSFKELPSHIKTDRKLKIKISNGWNDMAYITFIQTIK